MRAAFHRFRPPAVAFTAVIVWGSTIVGVYAESRAPRTRTQTTRTKTSPESEGRNRTGSGGATTTSGTGATTSGTGTAATGQYKVFAWNDLGMHCYDSDFSIFSLLPVFNQVHSQVVRVGSTPLLCSNNEVSVSYLGVRDPAGSINTTSIGKTNFWTYCKPLYGVSLAPDVGILGAKMPGKTNAPQPMTYDSTVKWNTAPGIPITCTDDAGSFHPYPLMRFQATPRGKTTAAAYVDAVVPVSSEMDCKSCHNNGGIAAGALQTAAGLTLSTQTNLDLQSRENIVRLHDVRFKTQLWQARPVLCAACHYSKALDLGGTGPSATQLSHATESAAMHTRHGKTIDNQLPTATKPAIISSPGVDACYKCHPGNVTNCLRSVMAGAGLACQNCHGGLLAVGGYYKARQPWTDLPKCQSCHTGDFNSHLGSTLPATVAYSATDPSATPILAPSSRFAENAGKLYRFSTGHSGLACSACHGSPHAEWPGANPQAYDNVAATELQGHSGPIVECSTCHGTSQAATATGGPHGMHNVNSAAWVSQHHDLVEKSGGITACKACHGLSLQGTYLSKAAADRAFNVEDGRVVRFAAGTPVSCSLCHENPINGGD